MAERGFLKYNRFIFRYNRFISKYEPRPGPYAPVCPRVPPCAPWGAAGILHPLITLPVIIIRLKTELWPGKQREPGARTRQRDMLHQKLVCLYCV